MALNEYVTITIALLLYLKVLFLVFSFFSSVSWLWVWIHMHICCIDSLRLKSQIIFWLDFYYPINIFKFDLV